jgi:hypothetical protein
MRCFYCGMLGNMMLEEEFMGSRKIIQYMNEEIVYNEVISCT